MKAQKAILILTGLCLLIPTISESRGLFYPQVRYESARALAMSGANLTQSPEVAYNLANAPSNLAMIDSFKAEVMNLSIESTSGALSAFMDGKLTTPSFKGFKSALSKYEDTMIGVGASVFPAIAFKGFSAGLMMTERVRVYSDGDNYRSEMIAQTIPMVGFGLPLARGIMRLGYSLQYVNQATGNKLLPTSTVDPEFSTEINEGKGLSHNASVGWVLPFTYLPSLTINARNIGGTTFTEGSLFSRASNPTGVPGYEPMVVDAGFSISPRIAGTLKSNWSVQFNDVFFRGGLSLFEHLAAGVEIDLWKKLQLRAGYSALTTMSFGFGYQTEDTSIGFAMFDEKPSLGLKTGPTDTRYMLQYTMKIGGSPKRDKNDENK